MQIRDVRCYLRSRCVLCTEMCLLFFLIRIPIEYQACHKSRSDPGFRDPTKRNDHNAFLTREQLQALYGWLKFQPSL